jgi:membrane fusion protein (multidrug efflux system)
MAEPEEKESAQEKTKSLGEKVRSHMPKSRRNRWLLLIGLIVAGVAAYEIWHYFSIRESTDDAKIDGYIVPVSARIHGIVEAVNVADYQYVKAGTSLVRLDPADYKLALARAQAELSVAKANAEAARTGIPIESVSTSSRVNAAEASLQLAQAGVMAAQSHVDTLQQSLVAARARLKEAEANYVKAAKDRDRLKELVVKDEVSRQQYDAAVAAAEATRAAQDSAKAGVSEAQNSIEVAKARLSQAQSSVSQAEAEVRSARTAPQHVAVSKAQADAAHARVLQAQAAVNQAQLNLEYTSITAKVDGVVSNRTVQLGQVIQPGEVLLYLAPLENLWVRANFKETQLKNIRPGQRATISVDALGGKTFSGYVESISGATSESFSLLPSENATGNFVKVVQRIPVKIRFDKGQDSQHRLRAGMSVVPTIMTD